MPTLKADWLSFFSIKACWGWFWRWMVPSGFWRWMPASRAMRPVRPHEVGAGETKNWIKRKSWASTLARVPRTVDRGSTSLKSI